jgi:hypothetical protein
MNEIKKRYNRIDFIDEDKRYLYAMIVYCDRGHEEYGSDFELAVFSAEDGPCAYAPIRMTERAMKVWNKADAFKKTRQRYSGKLGVITVESLTVILMFDHIKFFGDEEYVELKDIIAVGTSM